MPYLEDLKATLFVRQPNLDVNIQPSFAEQCLVQQLQPGHNSTLDGYCSRHIAHLAKAGQHTILLEIHLPVGHADDEDVVEGIDPINLGKQLIDNGVVHP